MGGRVGSEGVGGWLVGWVDWWVAGLRVAGLVFWWVGRVV